MYKFTQQFVEYCESNLNLEDYKGYDYSSISFVQAFWNDDILHTEIGIETEGNPKIALYENDMPMEEGRKLFLDFFHGKWRGNLDEFSLCETQP